MSDHMKQEVLVQRAADRHETPHERVYAEAHRRVVPANDLAVVLYTALAGLPPFPPGRYVIEVGWPYE